MFLDIGLGIFSAIAVSDFVHIPLSNTFILAGIFFALLPDFDFLFVLNRRIQYDHRNLIHYPLLIIPMGMLLLLAIGPEWSMLFGLATLAHFIHDSIGIGWGVQWLFPFSRNHISFLYLYRPKWKARIDRKLLYIWKHEEIDALDAKYGDHDWIRNIYFKMHPYAIVEFVGFIIAILALLSVRGIFNF